MNSIIFKITMEKVNHRYFISPKLCRVCGDDASAFNFNGLSCESCKAFFRRNAFKVKGKCQNGNKQCNINMRTRRKCRFCRLAKCFKIGMKKELVEYHKNKRMHKETESKIIKFGLTNKEYLSLAKIDRQQLEVVFNSMSVFVDERNVHFGGESNGLDDVLTSSVYYVKLVVKFANNFSAFNCLKREDQLCLLKSAYHDILFVRLAFLYSDRMFDDGIYVLDSDNCDSAVLVKFGEEMICSGFMEIEAELHQLLDDDVCLLNLISAVVLFKSHHKTSCPEFVRYHYHMYAQLLCRYMTMKHYNDDDVEANCRFTSLMVQIGKLSNTRNDVRMLLRNVGLSRLPQILIELYNLGDL